PPAMGMIWPTLKGEQGLVCGFQARRSRSQPLGDDLGVELSQTLDNSQGTVTERHVFPASAVDVTTKLCVTVSPLAHPPDHGKVWQVQVEHGWMARGGCAGQRGRRCALWSTGVCWQTVFLGLLALRAGLGGNRGWLVWLAGLGVLWWACAAALAGVGRGSPVL